MVHGARTGNYACADMMMASRVGDERTAQSNDTHICTAILNEGPQEDVDLTVGVTYAATSRLSHNPKECSPMNRHGNFFASSVVQNTTRKILHG
ncbi:MAG: hypothetical protein Q9224_005887 [Gallowayella concinna]